MKQHATTLLIFALFLLAINAKGQLDFTPAEQIVSKIKKTSFPNDTLNILSYGAKGDGTFDNKPSILNAIEACSLQGGGIVLIPAGVFYCKGPVLMKSNVNLHLAQGAVLRFSPDPADYLPAVFTRWEGVEIYNYSPMIYSTDQENIAITGKGTIDGNGLEQWVPFRESQWEARSRVHKFCDEQNPVSERVFGEGDFLRNSLIQFINCRQILLEGVTLVDCAFWMFHPVYCSDIIVRDVFFNSLVINNDGIDFDSSTMGLVEGCTFITGDDAVVFKSGRDRDGWRVNKPTRDIVVRNCTAPKVLHGIAFGSEMSGGIENIYVENFQLGQVDYQAIQFKANKDRGSYMKDIYVRNIDVDTADSHLIYFTNGYHSYRGGNAPTEFYNIHLENIRCKNANNIIQLQGLEEMPLHDITITNVTVEKANQAFSKKEFYHNIVLKNVVAGGKNIEL